MRTMSEHSAKSFRGKEVSWECRLMVKAETKGRESLGPQRKKSSKVHVVGSLWALGGLRILYAPQAGSQNKTYESRKRDESMTRKGNLKNKNKTKIKNLGRGHGGQISFLLGLYRIQTPSPSSLRFRSSDRPHFPKTQVGVWAPGCLFFWDQGVHVLSPPGPDSPFLIWDGHSSFGSPI